MVQYHLMAVEHTTHTIGQDGKLRETHYADRMVNHAIDNGVNSLADWKAFTSPLKKDIRSGQLELWHKNAQPGLIDALSEKMPQMNYAGLVRLEAATYYFRSLHMNETAQAEKADGIAVGLIHAIDIAKKNGMDLEKMPVFTDNPHVLNLNQHEYGHRFRVESYNEMKAVVERLVSAAKKSQTETKDQ